MYDPQLFEKETLPNGVELYTHVRTTPVTYISFLSELGLAHSGESAPRDGHLHLLEHLLMERTRDYEGRGALRAILERKGYRQNASTSGSSVEVWMGGPAEETATLIELLGDRVLRPEFFQEDIDREVSIIQNERSQRARFYPGSSPSGKWYNTEVINGAWYPLERIFGSDDDLTSATPTELAATHKTLLNHGTPKVVAVLPDSSALPMLRAAFGTFERVPTELTVDVSRLKFMGEGPFSGTFSNIKTLSHSLEILNPQLSQKEESQVWFLMHMLGNSDIGTVYSHFRHELSWIYSLTWWSNNGIRGSSVGFEFPLEKAERIPETVRLLPEIIEQTLADDVHYLACRERLRGVDAFGYQKASDVLDGATSDLQDGHPIRTQAMRNEWYDELASKELRVELGKRYLNFKSATQVTFYPEDDC